MSILIIYKTSDIIIPREKVTDKISGPEAKPGKAQLQLSYNADSQNSTYVMPNQ